MIIAVVDAKGAGMGREIVKRLCHEIKALNHDITIAALGTNETASENMLKEGADIGITGDADICNYLYDNNIFCIIGPIGILCCTGINGEITSNIARCIFRIDCRKYILPLQKHGIYIPGTTKLQIKDMTSEIICDIQKYI